MSKVGKVMKKVFLDKVGPQSVEKGTFSKAMVRVSVSFSRCENVHFGPTRCCRRLGK